MMAPTLSVYHGKYCKTQQITSDGGLLSFLAGGPPVQEYCWSVPIGVWEIITDYCYFRERNASLNKN
jgi:hypothetical protein